MGEQFEREGSRELHNIFLQMSVGFIRFFKNFQANYDRCNKTGASGGPEVQLTEVDWKVLEIIGRKSALVRGMGVPESMENFSPMPRVIAESIDAGEGLLRPNVAQSLETSYEEDGTESQVSCSTVSRKRCGCLTVMRCFSWEMEMAALPATCNCNQRQLQSRQEFRRNHGLISEASRRN